MPPRVRSAWTGLAVALVAWLCTCSAGCGRTHGTDAAPTDGSVPTPASSPARSSTPQPARPPGAVPAHLAPCHGCHRSIVELYAAHGMADSLGPVRDPPDGRIVNARTGSVYAFAADAEGTVLTATTADGGVRRQRVVGRIGAGLIDRSFVTVELTEGGPPSDRLQFAPVEALTGRGLALSPFEHDARPAGLDQPVTARCLGCHTTRAVRGPDPSVSGTDYPRQRLGRDLLKALEPLGCEACHGPTARHVAIMEERIAAAPEDIGIVRLGDLDAPSRLDVCARCHLEGDAHIELSDDIGYGPRSTPLAAVRPVLVPARAVEDHRLVSQVERLALSACYRGSPRMHCTSCHEPHRAVAAQGTDAFDAACVRCHEAPAAGCSRGAGLSVRDVTGEAPRSALGCVDCHVRRSQPFDVPDLRTADHLVQRRIAPPGRPAPRHVADPDGPLRVHDDGRLGPRLATPDGERWAAGLRGLGYWQQGRVEAASQALATFPPPGSADARRATAPDGLAPLETHADFHHVRGLVLEAGGDVEGARAAYTDALARDAAHPEARLNRGFLRLLSGDTAGSLEDAEALTALYPHSEKAWNLTARARARLGDLVGAVEALGRSTTAWPADPGVWHDLGRLLLLLDDSGAARAPLERAAALQPSRPGLARDLQAAGAR